MTSLNVKLESFSLFLLGFRPSLMPSHIFLLGQGRAPQTLLRNPQLPKPLKPENKCKVSARSRRTQRACHLALLVAGAVVERDLVAGASAFRFRPKP